MQKNWYSINSSFFCTLSLQYAKIFPATEYTLVNNTPGIISFNYCEELVKTTVSKNLENISLKPLILSTGGIARILEYLVDVLNNSDLNKETDQEIFNKLCSKVYQQYSNILTMKTELFIRLLHTIYNYFFSCF